MLYLCCWSPLIVLSWYQLGHVELQADINISRVRTTKLMHYYDCKEALLFPYHGCMVVFALVRETLNSFKQQLVKTTHECNGSICFSIMKLECDMTLCKTCGPPQPEENVFVMMTNYCTTNECVYPPICAILYVNRPGWDTMIREKYHACCMAFISTWN